MIPPSAARLHRYRLMAELLDYIGRHHRRQLVLDELADFIGVSASTLKRMFEAYVGLPPATYTQALRAHSLRERLAAGRTALDGAFEHGYSSTSGVHALMVRMSAMEPGDVRRRGQGMPVSFGFSWHRWLGGCLVARSPLGILRLAFGDNMAGLEAELRALKHIERADFRREDDWAADFLGRLFARPGEARDRPVRLLVPERPSDIRFQVWDALLRVPPGALICYQDLARILGREKASRVAGRHVSANGIAYLIPCHRVIRKTAHISPYRWELWRKVGLLGWELAHADLLNG